MKINLLLKDTNKICNIRILFLFLHYKPRSIVRDEDNNMKCCNVNSLST